MLSKFENRVIEKIKMIPEGKVTTYGLVAKKIGNPNAARAVGNAVGKNPLAPEIPCHRVVCRDGKVGGYSKGVSKKIKLLRKEGLEIKNKKIVNFAENLYKF